MTDPKDNVFTYFKNEIETIFKTNQKKIDGLIVVYNKTAHNTSMKKFAEVMGLKNDLDFAEIVRFSLSAITNQYLENKKKTLNLLDNSKLDSKTKRTIRTFFSKMNEKALHGLKIQYHISETMFDFSTLVSVTDTKALTEIKDHANTPLGYLHVTRIKFVFDEDEDEKTMYATFSQDRLSHLISVLQTIYDENYESVKRHKNSIKGLPVID